MLFSEAYELMKKEKSKTAFMGWLLVLGQRKENHYDAYERWKELDIRQKIDRNILLTTFVLGIGLLRMKRIARNLEENLCFHLQKQLNI